MSLLPSRPDVSPDDGDPRVVDVESEDAEAVIAALSSETARSLLAALHEDPGTPSELADRVDTSVQNAQYHLDKLADAGAIEVADTAYSAKGREMDVYAPSDQPLVIFAGDSEDQSTLRTALSRLLGAVGVLGVASLVVQALASEDGLLGGAGDAGAPVQQTEESGGDDVAAEAADPSPNEELATETPGDDIAVASDGTPTVTTEDTPAATGTPEPSETVTTPEPSPEATPTPESLSTPTPEATPVPDPQTAVDTAASLPPGVLFFAGGVFVLAVVILFSRR